MPHCSLNWKGFTLEHNCPKRFYGPWPMFPLPVYLAYRLLIAGYTCGFTFWYAFLSDYSWGKPWLFCTLWSYSCQAFTLNISFWITISRTCCPQKRRGCNSNTLDWHLKLKWVLYNISSSVPLLVTFGYWILLWRNNPFRSDTTYLISDVQIHGLNSVVAMVNQVLDPTPMRPHHFIYPLGFLIVYGAFSLIYHMFGGVALYPFLDWDKVGPTAFMSLILCTITCVVHLGNCYVKQVLSTLFPDMADYVNIENEIQMEVKTPGYNGPP